MPTFKLLLAYDGTDFAGWQWQQGSRTVQGALEEAWQSVTGESIRVVASGRTDAGVHALGQVVGIRSQTLLSADVLQRALNAELPRDVAVLGSDRVSDDFHAIRDAVRKRYRYVVDDGPVPDVLARRYAWYSPKPLDVDAMQHAAQALLGRHDFTSYQTLGSERVTTERTVLDISIQRPAEDPRKIWFEIEADGFLYNMVRVIVGTLVQVGRGVRPETWPGEVLQAQDRRAAGMTAPPQGLFLLRVDYEETSKQGRG
ncbi:MAG: tRNA pseudouridine(38-40) synthase TruA [Planctomycetes bacterium]|nr:tRNA pseudouridine(38-40) synthase TruA [Planctomycetota bacterium]